MATATSDTERLTINSEEEAIATLQRALAQEFSNKVVDLDFEDWPSIKLKYVGPKFHGTVTPEIAQALVDLQEAMNRSYMVAVRGTTNLQGLGEEEKRELELIARVDENCTLLLIDLGPWAEKLATELVSKMTGTELIITVVSTATVLTAGWVVKSYLKDRSENKGLELAKDERIQLSQEETRRHQILVTALTQNAPARTANELAQEPRNSLMKSAIEAESFTYQDAVTITGEEARQTYRAQRRTALEVQLNGTYTVEGFNWNADGENARVRIKRRDDGEEFTADLSVNALTEEQKVKFKDSTFEHAEVYLSINGTILDDKVTTAKIVSVSLQPAPPAVN